MTKKVMISSTARDLEAHRQKVVDACLRQSMLPIMMEHWPAGSDAEALSIAVSESLRKVDEADLYLGIFAHRYGYVPAGSDISVTEMEYERAVERKIPRLIFVMDDAHPISIADVEMGAGAAKLKDFKDRLLVGNIVNFFKSPDELRALVINSLSHHREREITAFHYISDIPTPPDVYIAHPYTLLQVHDLVGRNSEFNLLTDWVANSDAGVYRSSILNIVAIGGMGKSALTWKWFNDIAPEDMKPLRGRMWWSFYESDATFENFIIRALAYVTSRTREEIEKNTNQGEREEQLLAVLNQEPFLLVLDGMERLLIAYARIDANRLADSDLDQHTANNVAGALGLPASAAQSFTGQHWLRKTADPRTGNFLRKLARVEASRILVSTRLYPADLQTVTGEPLPGSFAYFLPGLNDDDALHLWRAFGVTGSREELLALFHTFENHPLLIQALASEIARYRRAPGAFDIWRQNNPEFDPFRSLPLAEVQSHVLSFALRGLDESEKKVLHIIAAFRMPAAYDTLAALLLEMDKTFPDENALDAAMSELEDRGLLGWDKRANRYDLHPIVRGVIWSELKEDTQRGIYQTLHDHFEAIPTVNENDIKKIDDLIPVIELYDKLVRLGRYDEAWELLDKRASEALLRIHASRQIVELLTMLFPEGLEELPRLNEENQVDVLFYITISYQLSGQPGRAVSFGRRAYELGQATDHIDKDLPLIFLSYAMCLSGQLRQAEFTARQSVREFREKSNLSDETGPLLFLGLTLAARGMVAESKVSLARGGLIAGRDINSEMGEWPHSYLTQRALWMGDLDNARLSVTRAWEIVQDGNRYKMELIRVTRLRGMVALELGELTAADDLLHDAVSQAQAVSHDEEGLPALIGLAELRRRQGDLKAARELLEDVWESAERGPYPLFHADAYNVLAQIERDAGNHAAAIEAATHAYRLAWCDGPPFAYHWGLEAARNHLRELDAPEPSLPPFDESKYEPMPLVEIDPTGSLESKEADPDHTVS